MHQQIQLWQSITLAIAAACDFPMALQTTLQQVCLETGWVFAEAWVPNEDGTRLVCDAAWYADFRSDRQRETSGQEQSQDSDGRSPFTPFRRVSESISFAPGESLPGRVWRSKQPEWIQDVSQADEAAFLRAPFAAAMGFRACFGAPILAQDQVVAVLVFFMTEPQPEDPHLVDLVLPITTQLGAIFQLKQTEMALLKSQKQLAALIDTLPGIVFAAANDPEWTMTYLSEGCLELTGYRHEELVGDQRTQTYNAICHPDDVAIMLAAIAQSIANRQPYVVEYRIYTKTGQEKWLWEKGQGLYDRDGQVLGLEGFITDITELKQAEKALREQEGFLRLVLDNIPLSIFWKDLDSVYRSCNQHMADRLGLESIEAIAGKTDFDLPTHHAMAEFYRQEDRQIIASGEPLFGLLSQNQRADGSSIWVDVNKLPILDVEGKAVGILGTLQDITARKQAETALQTQLAAIEAASDGIALLNPNGVYTYLNQAHVKLFGYTSATELVGKTWQTLYPTDEVLRLAQLVLPRLQHDGQWQGEAIAQCKDGSTFPQEVSLTVLDGGGLVCVCRDISQRKQTEAALRQAEQKYRSIFENAVEGIFQTATNGRYLTANPMLARLYGYDSPEALMATLTDIGSQLYVDPQRRQEFERLMQSQEAVWGFESQVYRQDRSIIWISENARALRNADGELLGYEGTVEDITNRKQAEADLRQRDNLLQGVATATNHLLTNIDTEAAIAKTLQILGEAAVVDRVYIYQNHPHEPTGQPAMSMRYEWVREAIAPSIQQPHWQNQPYSEFGLTRWYDALSRGYSVGGVTHELSSSEQEILRLDAICSILMVPIFIEDQLWGYIGFDDCHTERRWSKNEESILVTMAASIGGVIARQQADATIRYQALHDLLTGLPNRMLFHDRLSLALANAHRQQTMLAVMFLDLDRFKTINDTLGHAMGDQLLQSVADRLSECLREGDTIARWGGDEFTLLLPQINCAEDAAKAAQRLLDALKPSFHLELHELYISSSVGIAIYPHDGKDAHALLKNADAALYRVKEQGRNGYQFYTAAINFKASERLALESSLHHALNRQELTLYYQPQVNIITGQITRMEALIRWLHPELGLIPPRTFIPIAEETGLITAIGTWVLRTACAQAKVWQNANLQALRMAVNLSARQFQQPDLVEIIVQILAETGLAPHYLELEITETTAMQDVEFTTATLKKLHAMGIYISLDDFGIGYSSLGYLKLFPLQTLKIDQSFIRELLTSPNDAAIVRAVIALGHGLDMNVVAEGVETGEQLDYLRSLNCADMQGFLFSKPMPAEAATQFLMGDRLPKLMTTLEDDADKEA